jgi:hypothetical protein
MTEQDRICLGQASQAMDIIQAQLTALRSLQDRHPWLYLLEPAHEAADSLRSLLDILTERATEEVLQDEYDV